MANFEKGGQNVHGQSVVAPFGSPFEIGLWGPLDTFVAPPRELDVTLRVPNRSVRIEKAGMKGNVRLWKLTGLPVGTSEIVAKNGQGAIWSAVTVNVVMPAPLPGSVKEILNTARRTLNINGEKFWELNEEYGQRLLNAMTKKEKEVRLPPIAGTGGFIDTKVRRAFRDMGARQDGPHSWGVFSYKGKYFLTRLAHHTWTTKVVNGKVVRVPFNGSGVEAYEIPAQLGIRVASP